MWTVETQGDSAKEQQTIRFLLNSVRAFGVSTFSIHRDFNFANVISSFATYMALVKDNVGLNKNRGDTSWIIPKARM